MSSFHSSSLVQTIVVTGPGLVHQKVASGIPASATV